MANSIKRTLSTTVAAGLAFSAFSGLTATAAMADDTSDYPDEQIRLVIPYSPGGATDIIFRLVATELEDELGVAVVPVNMSGASATIGSREVRNADPDGYTILGSHDVIAAAYLSGVVDYSFDAFESIALITQTPNMATISSDLEIDSLDAFIDYVNENPGELAWGITPGSTSHFFVAMMMDAIGLEDGSLRMIDYEGTGDAIVAVQRGEIAGTMTNYTSARSEIEEGTFTALAVAHDERLPQMPDTPSFVELGYDMEHATSRGFFAPLGTPEPIIETLSAAIEAVAQSPELSQQIENELGSIVRYLPPEEYDAFVANVQATLERTAENIDM